MMKIENQKEARYRVQALERALDILDSFTFQRKEMSLSEIVHLTGLNITTAKRLISNLSRRGYLRQDHESKRYRLGMRLFELGGIISSSFSLRKVAAYPMSHLQNETGGTVLLGVRMDDELVYVDKREGRGMIRIASDIGWRRPLHYGMLGMVLTAYLEPKDVRRIFTKTPLEAHTPYSITDEDAFSLRLEQIRKDGCVAESGEAVEGVMGIAAPIRDHSRRVIAALGVALPMSQLAEKRDVQRVVNLVKEATDTISSDMGYLKV